MVRVFRVFVPTSVIGILISEIVLAFSCYTLATLFLLEIDPMIDFLYGGGAGRIAMVVASIILGIYFTDLYSDLHAASGIRMIQHFCLVIGLAFLVQALMGYVNRSWVLSRWVMLYGSGMALVIMPAWRMLYANVVMRGVGQRSMLFLGCGELVRLIAGRIAEEPKYGYMSLGFLADDAEKQGLPVALGERLGSLGDVTSVTTARKPALVVAGLEERRGRLPVNELLDLRMSGVTVEEAANVYETLFGRISVLSLRPSQLIFSSSLGPNPRYVSLQTLYSTAVALVGLALTGPIMLLVALLVKITSRGPIIYRQCRVGRNGEEFEVFKFRSMYEDAEARTGAIWASRNDPRITPLGRWLRKLRLDELPQFFNVLRGEMSIVGPRPERPEFVRTLSEQIPFYRQRHCVKPGITGWAQINHKYGDTIEDTIAKLEYDLYYIKNLSPALDLYIIFHTAKVMLLSRGAQ